ncbi:hypothetical protein Plhal304r1_c054g0139311 [Plasmopara halstedii]
MYRAKDCVIAELHNGDPLNFHLFPCDDRGRFSRAIVLHSPSWFTSDPGVYGVDAAYITHRKYKDAQVVMVGRD